jgi:hypothetical protein
VTGRSIEMMASFDEYADVAVAGQALRELAGGPTPFHAPVGSTVICSQGKLIPRLLATLVDGDPAGYETAKGDGWLVTVDEGGAVAVTSLRD